MTQYTIRGSGVLRELDQLPDRDKIWDDLKQLEVDPMNQRGDLRSTIQPYKDRRYSFVYSILVGNGHLVVYRVLQDYPQVILKGLVIADRSG